VRLVISIRELATVLAALRTWQHELDAGSQGERTHLLDDYHFDSKNTPLTAAEIDALCERLNCG
jgi:hypothetical protein